MRTLSLVVCVAAALAGCEKANPDRVEKFSTKLLSPGAEPRFTLRYKIPEGTKQAVDMVLDMDMNMSGAGMPGGDIKMPRMIMVNDIAVDKVGKDGAMNMVMTTTDIRLEDRPGSMGGLAGAMKAELDGMKGMRMTATLMPNGRTRNMKLDESSVTEKVREQMKQTEQMVDQMTTFLPEEPVGVGATWEVEQTIRQQGMRVNMHVVYELVEVSETHAVIKSNISMDAPAQTIEQQGVEVKLEQMSGSGTATSTLDFTKLVERIEAKLELDMRMSAMGQSLSMGMGMGMQMVPAGQTPAPPE